MATVTLASYQYDADGNLAGVVNSSGKPVLFGYDQAGRLTGWRDRNGHAYRYGYDGQGRCVRGEGPANALSGTFGYDPVARVTTWTDAAGAATTYQLNESSRVAAIIDPLGHSTRWAYDARGRVITRIDQLGRITRYTYDSRGNLTVVTRPDGTQARAEYDRQSQPVRLTDPAGRVWSLEYDGRGNRTRITAPDGAVTRFRYDADGHLSGITDALGAVTAVACNAAGLPTELTGPEGGRTHYVRDQLGRVTAVTGPDGGVTSLTWTVESWLTSRTFPDGTAESWSYDGEGNLVEHRNPAGGVTSYEHGPFDRLARVVRPDGTSSAFGYDHELRLTSVMHGGLTWRYTYDAAGRLAAETDYNNATTRYGYDPAGQLIRQVNACGQGVTFGYDQLGNVSTRSADGAETTFGYDQAGRLVSARNPDAEITLEYDELGRVTAQTCNGRTLTTQYDAAGRTRRRVTPSGATTGWEYDQAGQPVRMTAGEHELRFGYDPAGREVHRELPGGLILSQSWDPQGRLAVQALASRQLTGPQSPEGPLLPGQLLQRRAYNYRPDGYLDRIDDLLLGSRTFALDPEGRITAVTGQNWAERYAYDQLGNLTDATWPAPPPVPAATWLDTDVQGPREATGTLISRAGNVRYRHDQAGRVTQRTRVRLSRKAETWHYEWDVSNRLAAVRTPDGSTWRYHYDPFGRRVAKQRLDARRARGRGDRVHLGRRGACRAGGHRHPVQGTRRVVTWNYGPGSFTPLTQQEHTALRDAPQDEIDQRFYAIITDLAGTPSELTNPDGELAGRQLRTVWGGTIWSDGGAQTPLRFPGQYADPETGLHYNQQRYYDPVSGSYLTPDPLGLAPSANPHAYVSNPEVLTDPLGLMSCTPGNPPGPGKAAEDAGRNIVYRALNSQDAKTVARGEGIAAKNPEGEWSLEQHLVRGSSPTSWANDPWIATTRDQSVAEGFDQAGDKRGVVAIDLDQVPSAAAEGGQIYPRLPGEEGLAYYYSIWQQEVSVFQSIPQKAILGFVG